VTYIKDVVTKRVYFYRKLIWTSVEIFRLFLTHHNAQCLVYFSFRKAMYFYVSIFLKYFRKYMIEIQIT